MADRPTHQANPVPAGTAADGTVELTEGAFERLHDRTARPLWAYLRRVSGDPALADDLLQESYLRYLARPCPSREEDHQAAYLYRIASNLLRDRWRRRKTERGWLERLLADRSRKAAVPASDLGLETDIERVLSQLEPRQRAMLWLAYVEGCRHAEIAEILDVKAASVRVLLFRARRRLASLLERHGLAPDSARASGAPPRPPETALADTLRGEL